MKIVELIVNLLKTVYLDIKYNKARQTANEALKDNNALDKRVSSDKRKEQE